jgi:hypothetical protein
MKQDSWLYSDSFLKRSFAIWGHYFVANLIIGAAAFVIAFALVVAFGISLSALNPANGNGAPAANVDVR